MNRVHGEVDERYDVIVVGAGVGGLVAAALLSRHGRKVLILDHHYVAGGNSTLFRRGDYEFDVGLHYVGGCQPGGTIPTILEAAGARPLRFRPMEAELEQVKMPGFDFAVPRDRGEFERRLIARYPTERAGIRRYIKFLEQCDRLMAADKKGGNWAKIWGALRSPLATRHLMAPLGRLLDSCTQNLELRALLTMQHGTYAVAPNDVAAILHAGLANHYFESGGWYPEGGGQALSDSLVEAIEAHGGHLRLRSKVETIVVEEGRAQGVVFRSKRHGEKRVDADVVVSNADLKRTILELVGRAHFPPSYVERAESWEMALPLFVVFLGLDIPPEELPYGNANQWVVNDVDFDAEYASLYRGEISEAPSIYVSTASLKDPHNPKIAPPGHSNVEVMTVVPADPAFWGLESSELEDGSYEKNERYLAMKEKVVEACITQYERIVPGVRDHIVHSEAASPMTHSRFVRSTAGGAYGIAATPDQFLQNRPGTRGPIDGLYYAGTNCRAGHGIGGSMISGAQAAARLLGRRSVKALLDESIMKTPLQRPATA